MKRKWFSFSEFELRGLAWFSSLVFLWKLFHLWMIKKLKFWDEIMLEALIFSITASFLILIMVSLVSKKYQIIKSYKLSDLALAEKLSAELGRIDFVLKKKKLFQKGGMQLVFGFDNWSVIGKETLKVTIDKGKVYITGYKNTLSYIMNLKLESESEKLA